MIWKLKGERFTGIHGKEIHLFGLFFKGILFSSIGISLSVMHRFTYNFIEDFFLRDYSTGWIYWIYYSTFMNIFIQGIFIISTIFFFNGWNSLDSVVMKFSIEKNQSKSDAIATNKYNNTNIILIKVTIILYLIMYCMGIFISIFVYNIYMTGYSIPKQITLDVSNMIQLFLIALVPIIGGIFNIVGYLRLSKYLRQPLNLL
jgi:hypothetical protein